MKVSAAFSLLLLGIASPAMAQYQSQPSSADMLDRTTAPPGENRIGRTNNSSSTTDTLPAVERAQAERQMREFAQCVVRGDAVTPRRLLATEPGSDPERAVLRQIADRRSRCLSKGGKLRMSGNWMRGALAEQVYLRSYPDPVKEQAEPTAQVTSDARGMQAYHAFAACVVARDAPDADAAVRAVSGSDVERAAYRAAMPVLSSCLAGGPDSKLAIDRSVMRGYLAEALYNRRGKGA